MATTHHQTRSSTDILREAALIKDLIDTLSNEAVIYLAHKFNIDHTEAAQLVIKHAGVSRGTLLLAQAMVETSRPKPAKSSGKLNSLKDLTPVEPEMTLADAIRKVGGKVRGISAYEAIRLAQPLNNWTARVNAIARLQRTPDGSLWTALTNHVRPGSISRANNRYVYDRFDDQIKPNMRDDPRHQRMIPQAAVVHNHTFAMRRPLAA
jgi:hypothetical protein